MDGIGVESIRVTGLRINENESTKRIQSKLVIATNDLTNALFPFLLTLKGC